MQYQQSLSTLEIVPQLQTISLPALSSEMSIPYIDRVADTLQALPSLQGINFGPSSQHVFSRMATSSTGCSKVTSLELPHECYTGMLPPAAFSVHLVFLKSAFQNLQHLSFEYRVPDASGADLVVDTGHMLAHVSGLQALTQLSVEYSLLPVRDGLSLGGLDNLSAVPGGIWQFLDCVATSLQHLTSLKSLQFKVPQGCSVGVAEGSEAQLEKFRQFALRLQVVALRRSSGCDLLVPFLRQLHGVTSVASLSLVPDGRGWGEPGRYEAPELRSEAVLSGLSCLVSLRSLHFKLPDTSVTSGHMRCIVDALAALSHVSSLHCDSMDSRIPKESLVDLIAAVVSLTSLENLHMS